MEAKASDTLYVSGFSLVQVMYGLGTCMHHTITWTNADYPFDKVPLNLEQNANMSY